MAGRGRARQIQGHPIWPARPRKAVCGAHGQRGPAAAGASAELSASGRGTARQGRAVGLRQVYSVRSEPEHGMKNYKPGPMATQWRRRRKEADGGRYSVGLRLPVGGVVYKRGAGSPGHCRPSRSRHLIAGHRLYGRLPDQPADLPAAREAGFKYPVALTAAAWGKCVDVPPGVLCKDEAGPAVGRADLAALRRPTEQRRARKSATASTFATTTASARPHRCGSRRSAGAAITARRLSR
jgi:hypothetical protein